MALVEVYHIPGRGASVDDLLVEGIKSREQLIKEGKLEPINGRGLFDDHLSTIYFQWFPPHLEGNKEECDWISIEVDPKTTYVHNREFRVNNDRPKYNASRMNLSDYIAQHEKTKGLRSSLKPGQMIVWNPITVEPTTVSVDDQRVYDYTWQYLNEVLVPRLFILTSEFKDYHKARK